MEFVDTHCHIQSAGKSHGDRSTREIWAKNPDLTAEQLVNEAREAGVTRLITVGCDLPDSKLAIDCAARHDSVWASIGIHPHEAKSYARNTELKSEFAALTSAAKVVAIGECGLDYFYSHSPRDKQLEMLRFQIELALEADLPLIFHVREAFDDFWPVFDDYRGVRGVLHSYTDSTENMQRATKAGLFIGVNGIATFAKQAAQLEMYKAIPPQNLILETDAPFLTPTPYRGKLNEPKQIATIASYLSDLYTVDVKSLASSSTANAIKLFGLN